MRRKYIRFWVKRKKKFSQQKERKSGLEVVYRGKNVYLPECLKILPTIGRFYSYCQLNK
jgi:hypothetical protein